MTKRSMFIVSTIATNGMHHVIVMNSVKLRRVLFPYMENIKTIENPVYSTVTYQNQWCLSWVRGRWGKATLQTALIHVLQQDLMISFHITSYIGQRRAQCGNMLISSCIKGLLGKMAIAQGCRLISLSVITLNIFCFILN